MEESLLLARIGIKLEPDKVIGVEPTPINYFSALYSSLLTPDPNSLPTADCRLLDAKARLSK